MSGIVYPFQKEKAKHTMRISMHKKKGSNTIPKIVLTKMRSQSSPYKTDKILDLLTLKSVFRIPSHGYPESL